MADPGESRRIATETCERDVFKRMVGPLPLEIRCLGWSSPTSLVDPGFSNHYEPIGIFHPQRAKHESIHQAENGGVGANAERDRDNRHCGEAWMVAQHTEGKTKIFRHRRSPARATNCSLVTISPVGLRFQGYHNALVFTRYRNFSASRPVIPVRRWRV